MAAPSEIKVAILGCGFLGTALLQGFLRSKASDLSSQSRYEFTFSACVRSDSSLERLDKTLGDDLSRVKTGKGPEAVAEFARNADVILLGCAPDELDALLKTKEAGEAMQGKVVVSLLAGVSLQQLSAVLPHCKSEGGEALYSRVLPTLGAVIGESVTLIADDPNHSPSATTQDLVDELFAQIGSVQHISEKIMAEATALGAAVHALSIVAVDTLADAGAADGMPRDVALQLATSCLRSASGMFQNGWTTASMKNAMAIPTGITINAILNLEKQSRPAIAESARAAVAYTKGMSK